MIVDEHGVEWRVSHGDPASRIVNRLHRLGFKYVVLPRITLRNGTLCAGSQSGDIEPTVVQCEDTVRQARLHDVMEVLNA